MTKSMAEAKNYCGGNREQLTLIKTPVETNGEYILVEIILPPGSGLTKHYHTSFSVEFIPVEGILWLETETETRLLRPGQKGIAAINQVHRFYNPGKRPVCFRMKIAPAQINFLYCLQICFGLAKVGRTFKKGIPKRLDHLAIVLELSDTRFTGFLFPIQTLILKRARWAKKKGIDRDLLQRYC